MGSEQRVSPYSDSDLRFMRDHMPDEPQHVDGLDPLYERRRWLATLDDARAALHASERHRAMWEANANEWRHKLAESEGGRAALHVAGAKVVAGIDHWNEAVQGVIGRVPDYDWGELEALRAALASSGPAAAEWERRIREDERAVLAERFAEVRDALAALAGPPAPSETTSKDVQP